MDKKLHAKVTFVFTQKLHIFICESYMGFWMKVTQKLDKSYTKLAAFENLKAGFFILLKKIIKTIDVGTSI